MTNLHSAGLLPYRFKGACLQVLLVHPGGPFWAKKDKGVWSIPKGIVGDKETTFFAANREFREETGMDAKGKFLDLGELRQPSRKIIHVWAIQLDIDAKNIHSNNFILEWPKGSGMIQQYPEIDRGDWFSLARAREKISPGQIGFLERLNERLSHSKQK